MRWKVHGERPIYQNRWVNLWLAEVELPDGQRFEHHVIKMQSVAVVAVVDDRERVLMLRRHRFVTDTWAWELPAGLVEEGEDPEQTAIREVEEETGWRPGRVEPLVYSQPANGITTAEHFVFLARHADHVRNPTDTTEAEQVAWIPLADIPDMIDRREIVASASLIALLYLLVRRPA